MIGSLYTAMKDAIGWTRRRRRRPKLHLEALSLKTTAAPGLPYRHVWVTPSIANDGRDSTSAWRFEVSIAVAQGVRIGFPGQGTTKWGDDYVVRWDDGGRALLDRDVVTLAPFEVELPHGSSALGRYVIRWAGAQVEGDFEVIDGVDGEAGVSVHFHPDGKERSHA